MKEEWRDIVGYEGYFQISNYGRIRSLDREIICKNGVIRHYKGKLLKNGKRRNYYRVCFTYCGERIDLQLHRCVWEAFVGPIPEGYDIHHKDHNPQNNSLDNFQMVTKKEHYDIHKEDITHNIGGARKNSHIIEQYTLQGDFVRCWSTFSEIEKEFGWSRSHICACCRGRKNKAYGSIWRYGEKSLKSIAA